MNCSLHFFEHPMCFCASLEYVGLCVCIWIHSSSHAVTTLCLISMSTMLLVFYNLFLTYLWIAFWFLFKEPMVTLQCDLAFSSSILLADLSLHNKHNCVPMPKNILEEPPLKFFCCTISKSLCMHFVSNFWVKGVCVFSL